MDPEALQDLKEQQARISNIQSSITSGDFKRLYIFCGDCAITYPCVVCHQCWVKTRRRIRVVFLPGLLQLLAQRTGVGKPRDVEIYQPMICARVNIGLYNIDPTLSL